MEIIAQVRYDKLSNIGGEAAQNSSVFRAYDHHLATELVVKEIDKARIGDSARYFTEARAVHASAHPRVVPVHWAAETADLVCIAMPLMSGGSLAERIRSKPLRASELIRVAQDLCEGVAQVHIAGFVHLDIKPTNVLFDGAGRAAVSDFGLAMKVDSTGTADARDFALYPAFLPPEFIASKGIVTHAADVYQIGLTLYRAANGEPYFQEQWADACAEPFPASRQKIRFGEFPDRTFLPHVPLRLRQAITRALDTDPARRPIGARALAEELAAIEVRHDWEVEQFEPQSKLWRLRQAGRADVVVTQLGALPNVSVEIHMESAAGRKRKRRDEWTSDIRTTRQLNKALRAAFRAATR